MANHRSGFLRQTSREAAKKAQVDREVDYREVARIAYQLYEARGRADGHDQADWLKAEALAKQRANQS